MNLQDTLVEVKRNLLGPLSVGYYVSAFIMSGIALVIMAYYRSASRDEKSPNTPVHFSFSFLLWDNAKRLGAGMLVMYVLYRFSSEFLNSPLSMRLALLIGFLISFGIEPLIKWLIDRSELFSKLVQMPREDYMNKLTQKANTELENVQSPPADRSAYLMQLMAKKPAEISQDGEGK